MFCFFMMFAAAGGVVCDVVLGIALGSFKPWNVWFGFRIVSILFLFIGCGFWLLPIYFVFLTCNLLVSLFDDLYKRMTSLHSMDLPAFRVKHNTLCDLVELTDKMLSPLLLMIFGLYIPFICFNLYQIANLPEEGPLVFLSICLVWLLASSVVLGAVMMFASRISEKVSSFQKILQSFPVSTEDEGKLPMLTMLILDLQGEPKGLSIGGLTVITKSLSLTIVGVIISYFTVMLSLPT